MLTPQNIWDRIRSGLRVNEEIVSKLLVLRNTNPTVLIAKKCANALFVFRLLDLYSKKVVEMGSYIVRLEFAYARLFDLSTFACICEFWQEASSSLHCWPLTWNSQSVRQFSAKSPGGNSKIVLTNTSVEALIRSAVISLWSSYRALAI